MHSFHINSFGAAILLSALFMGLLGALVVAPIACIEFMWNSFATHFCALPAINPWQAILLYLAVACIVYLMGWVQIEIKTSTVE
jgi:hypothetical protein